MEDLSPLRENGVNIGQVGLPFPDSTLVEAAADTEYGYIEGVTAIRNLYADQPFDAEDIISLSDAPPLDLDREKAERLLRYFMDVLRSKENSFRGDREPQVMAKMLLDILEYVSTHKFLGLDQTQWPISPFFMRAIRKMVNTVSSFKGCAFLKRSEAWRGVRWYLNVLAKMVKEEWRINKAIRRECQWALKNINIANSEGYGV